jgi:hypothetical protein
MPEILVRFIQEIRPDKWAELEAIDSKYVEIEEKLGFPPKKRYRSLMGGYHYDTLLIDRVWESLAQLEEVTLKSMVDSEYQKLQEELVPIMKSQRVEMYLPMP